MKSQISNKLQSLLKVRKPLISHHQVYPENSSAPAFLIIGAQKAGTTALFEYLSNHPSLNPSNVKEIDYFSCDELYDKGIDFYHSHFHACEDDNPMLSFEASPSYLRNPKAAERIFAYNKNMLNVIILREPCQRAFSAWNMYRKNFLRDREWFSAWMERCDRDYNKKTVTQRTQKSLDSFIYYIKEELEAAKNRMQIEAPVLSHGLYYDQLMLYLKYFKIENLFVMTSDNLKNDTVGKLKELERFLRIPSYDWTNVDLSPVFSGEYLTIPDNEAMDILNEYYCDSNYHLSNNFNISF